MPKFSIVVPTCDRSDTLGHTLRSILAQSFEDFEVIVMDNGSDERTPACVAAVAQEPRGERIKYVAGPRVSMHRNWERALDHVSGEYVLFLGDDDGLTRRALSTVSEAIRRNGCKLIGSEPLIYYWPSFSDPRLDNTGGTGQMLRRCHHIFVPEDHLSRFLRNEISLHSAPSIYSTFVHRSIIDEHRRKHGRYFYLCPDDASALAHLALTERIQLLAYPVVIRAASGHSTGLRSATQRLDSVPNMFVGETVSFHPLLQVDHPLLLSFAALWVAQSRLEALLDIFGTPPGDLLGDLIVGLIRGIEFQSVLPELNESGYEIARVLAERVEVALDRDGWPAPQQTSKTFKFLPVGTSMFGPFLKVGLHPGALGVTTVDQFAQVVELVLPNSIVGYFTETMDAP